MKFKAQCMILPCVVQFFTPLHHLISNSHNSLIEFHPKMGFGRKNLDRVILENELFKTVSFGEK